MTQRQPEFRDGSLDEFSVWMKEALKACQLSLSKTCITCISFREYARNDANERHPAEWCMHYKEKPPARVIAYGCKSYCHDDEIPF